jgi:hypothetical protein
MIDKEVIFGILRGWIVGPAGGVALGYAFGLITRVF